MKMTDGEGCICKIKTAWKTNLCEKFSTLYVGQLFRNAKPVLVAGSEDGVVRIYPIPTNQANQIKCIKSMETKGGPIQRLIVSDVTKFNSQDLMVADSRGMLTIFSNEQILSRKAVSEHCIGCLQVQQDALGQIAIVAGDSNGHIYALSPYSDLWRIRLADTKHIRGISNNVSITSLLSVNLTNSQGQINSYILAADNCQHLYFIHQGQIVAVKQTPSNITAMCSGTFVAIDDIESPDILEGNNSSYKTQVALGCDTGAIFVLANYQIYTEEFANVQHPVTSLKCLKAADSQSTDTLLCAGNFDALCVIREGKEVGSYKTPSWINSLTQADIDNDGLMEVVIGCRDNSLHALKISFS